ncbi:hypothetical protein VKT23_007931 [Stygiomarasmius scandens]|uniref:Uncharacterized protein n=1 Tax=Marasmiellus scandens TaxID=2682957 RepID=A0ABR1JJZ8_9AGAR
MIPRPVASSSSRTLEDMPDDARTATPTSRRNSLFDEHSMKSQEQIIHPPQPKISEAQPDSIHNSHPSSNTDDSTQGHEYTMRLRYILKMLRDDDIARYDNSQIPDQELMETPDGQIYLVNRPDVEIPIPTVEEGEITLLRNIYPAPSISGVNSNMNENQTRGDNPRKHGKAKRNFLQEAKSKISRAPLFPGAQGGFIRHDRSTRRPMPSNSSSEDNENKNQRLPHGSGNNNSRESKALGRRRNDGSPPSDPHTSDSDNDTASTSSSSKLSVHDDYNIVHSNKPPKPAVFGTTRFSSVDRSFNEKETFTYNATPRSHEEVMRASFRSIESVIMSALYSQPLKGNSNVQKTILLAIPKLDTYSGESSDFVVFDDWIRDVIRWMNIADLCGPDV